MRVLLVEIVYMYFLRKFLVETKSSLLVTLHCAHIRRIYGPVSKNYLTYTHAITQSDNHYHLLCLWLTEEPGKDISWCANVEHTEPSGKTKWGTDAPLWVVKMVMLFWKKFQMNAFFKHLNFDCARLGGMGSQSV